MRCATDGKYPRYIVWENVPGAFSSNKGADFQSVLEEVCSVKGYEIHTPRPERWANAGEIMADDFSLAWRVFDAQYWGVPQRPEKYYLSPKACLGILRRASARGKELPELLRKALEHQAASA